MQKTNNYDLFKKAMGNRPIDESNLKKIINSIKTRNLLEYRPILVSKNMEVIDGQHRLEAAKALGLDVFYIVKEEFQPDDMHLLNHAQKGWSVDDYVNYHAKQGKKKYQELQAFCAKNELTSVDFFSITGKTSGFKLRGLKRGTDALEDLEADFMLVTERLRYITAVRNYLDAKVMGKKLFIRSKSMMRALCQLLGSSEFDKSLFFDKLAQNITRIGACRTAEDYYSMLKGFYNYRNQSPLP